MKTPRYLCVLCCLLLIVGCSEKAEPDSKFTEVQIDLSIDPSIAPYLSSVKGDCVDVAMCEVRWNVEIFNENAEGELVERRVWTTPPAGGGNHTTTMTFSLPEAVYRIAAWADYTDPGSLCDKYYKTESLAEIRISDTYLGSSNYKDAFCCCVKSLNVSRIPPPLRSS